MSVTVTVEDKASAQELVWRGLRFTDRSIPMEILLKQFRPPLDLGKEFCLAVKDGWESEELFSLARGSFETVGRFAVAWSQEKRR